MTKEVHERAQALQEEMLHFTNVMLAHSKMFTLEAIQTSFILNKIAELQLMQNSEQNDKPSVATESEQRTEP